MINTFSAKDNAIAAIPEFCKVKEQDVFVCHITYPFGEEWSLRLRNEIMCKDNVVYEYFLPITHHFVDRDNAIREAGVWEGKLNRAVIIDRNYKYEKGYKIFSHYTLIT